MKHQKLFTVLLIGTLFFQSTPGFSIPDTETSDPRTTPMPEISATDPSVPTPEATTAPVLEMPPIAGQEIVLQDVVVEMMDKEKLKRPFIDKKAAWEAYKQKMASR